MQEQREYERIEQKVEEKTAAPPVEEKAGEVPAGEEEKDKT